MMMHFVTRFSSQQSLREALHLLKTGVLQLRQKYDVLHFHEKPHYAAFQLHNLLNTFTECWTEAEFTSKTYILSFRFEVKHLSNMDWRNFNRLYEDGSLVSDTDVEFTMLESTTFSLLEIPFTWQEFGNYRGQENVIQFHSLIQDLDLEGPIRKEWTWSPLALGKNLHKPRFQADMDAINNYAEDLRAEVQLPDADGTADEGEPLPPPLEPYPTTSTIETTTLQFGTEVGSDQANLPGTVTWTDVPGNPITVRFACATLGGVPLLGATTTTLTSTRFMDDDIVDPNQ